MLYAERQKLEDIDDLYAALGNAIKLEFSTVPPYLTALYSIKPGHNAAIASILRDIVIEEMFHLSLVCNILNAVGGQPELPSLVPTYPGPLPMGIGSEPGRPFIVPLKRLSIETVQDVFMVIEEPEHPPNFPEGRLVAAVAEQYHTIGEFYEAVATLIENLGPSIFTDRPERQVTGWVATDRLFAIHDAVSARRAIRLIVTQGEGTRSSPVGGVEGLAHFFRFQEIQRGETLRPDPSVPEKFSWGPPPIVLDKAGVWPMVDNPPEVPLPAGSPVARRAQEFDVSFTAMVDALQQAFDGRPKSLGSALAQMYSLRLAAQSLMPMPLPGGETAGPRFLYLPSAGH